MTAINQELTTGEDGGIMSLNNDAEGAKLRGLVHNTITTSLTTISRPDMVENPQATNAWKWQVICQMGGRNDSDIFVHFPYQQAWDTEMGGNLQMLCYIADLRLQALDFIEKNNLWPDKAELARYRQVNTYWYVRARVRVNLNVRFGKDRDAIDDATNSHRVLH